MSATEDLSSDDLLRQVASAIRQVQDRVRWKRGKDLIHLERRVKKGHLPVGATLEDYEAVVHQIVLYTEAEVYLFRKRNLYPAVLAPYREQNWLVIFSLDGLMETAFALDEPEEEYFRKRPSYSFLGSIEEIINE